MTSRLHRRQKAARLRRNVRPRKQKSVGFWGEGMGIVEVIHERVLGGVLIRTSVITGRKKFVSWLAVLIIYLLRTQIIGFSAERDEVQLMWSKMAPLIHHKKVALLMPNGTRIEGQVLDVEPDA